MAGMTLDELMSVDNKCMIVLSDEDKHSWKEVQEYLLSMGCVWPTNTGNSVMYPIAVGDETFSAYFVNNRNGVCSLTYDADGIGAGSYVEKCKNVFQWFTADCVVDGSTGKIQPADDYDHAMGIV